MAIASHVRDLRREAVEADQRRLIGLLGDRRDSLNLLRSWDFLDLGTWAGVGAPEGPWETVEPARGEDLLGRTVPGLVLDAVDDLRPNAIGRAVGAVAGGGLVVLLLDDPERWIEGPLRSDERFAVVPYTPEDVGSRFRRRFVRTLREHRGVTTIDASGRRLLTDGRCGTPPWPVSRDRPSATGDVVLDRCLTADQRRCVEALRDLTDGDVGVVEAHRGRGKSSAAGLAAAAHARAARRVLVTGPGYQSVREALRRAAEVLDPEGASDRAPRAIRGVDGGWVEYRPPHEAVDRLDDADVALVDEAAALPVARLRAVLDAGVPAAFLTTVHGYEGTGRGFAVRFRDSLERSGRPVTDLDLSRPIRYAPGDPVEVWLFRALLLDASPIAAAAVQSATPETATYRAVDRDDLVDDEPFLRELFGLLVLAHYRTEPDDLVRVLDAPNVRVRCLTHDGHPVAVALLAEEGRLPAGWRDRLYRGESIRGHMLPDLLTTQLRDRDAGEPAGLRVLRIATHGAVRSRGLGSRLLGAVEAEFADAVDWFGAGFGMSPRLLPFWGSNGYRTVHLSTSRNPRSGEHSAVMLKPASDAGRTLLTRHTDRLIDRLEGQLTDALREVEPVTLAAACRTIDGRLAVDLPEWVWDVVDHAPAGPGQVATAPAGFRRIALAGFLDGTADSLSPIERDLVVRRVLQGHPWPAILEEVDATHGDARHALGRAIRALTPEDRG